MGRLTHLVPLIRLLGLQLGIGAGEGTTVGSSLPIIGALGVHLPIFGARLRPFFLIEQTPTVRKRSWTHAISNYLDRTEAGR